MLPISNGLMARETLYVTDQLLLGLYANNDASGKRIATLESGEELELLDRNKNYAKIKTNGGSIGWVKTAFLVTEKPAKLLIKDAEIEKQKLIQEIEENKRKLALIRTPSAEDMAALKKELKERSLGLQQAGSRIDDLNRQLIIARAEFSWYKHIQQALDPLWWYLLVTIALLLSGILIGMRIVNNRLRKRFYGFKFE
jgi:SH3 domain protein